MFISSEDSGEEEVDGDVRQFLFVKPLSWRDAKVNKFMKQMDEKLKKRQTTRSKRQILPGVPGDVSTRPKPIAEYGANFWAFA